MAHRHKDIIHNFKMTAVILAFIIENYKETGKMKFKTWQ